MTNLGRLGSFGPAVENCTAFPLHLKGVLIRDESLVRLRHGGSWCYSSDFINYLMSLLGPSDMRALRTCETVPKSPGFLTLPSHRSGNWRRKSVLLPGMLRLGVTQRPQVMATSTPTAENRRSRNDGSIHEWSRNTGSNNNSSELLGKAKLITYGARSINNRAGRSSQKRFLNQFV